MRVVVNTMVDGVQRSGAGQVVANLLPQLVERDPGTTYLALVGANDAIFDPLCGVNGFELLRCPFDAPTGLKRILWNQTNLQSILRDVRADVFHAPVSDLVLAKTVPTVLTLEDIGEYHVRRKYSASRMLFRRATLPISVRRADHIVTVSNHSKTDICRTLGVNPNKITTIHNGVSPVFKRTNRELARKQLVRSHPDLPDSYILYVGRLMHPGKNLVALIRAYRRIVECHGVPHSLVLIGKRDWGVEAIEEEIHRHPTLGRIYTPGYVRDSDLPLFYNCADLFAFPSLYEGFGLPIVEAMASGIPVVTSNVSSLPEVGQDAVEYADPNSVTDISQAIWRLLADPARVQALIRKGIQRAGEFSWAAAADSYASVYRKVAIGA